MEYLFVSKIGSQVVGFAHLIEDGPQAGRVVVVRLAVEWSHTSVPLRLMRSVHSYCRSRGYQTLMLEASAAPRAVLRVLSRCGFQLVPDGYEPPCVDHHVEQVDGGVPAVQTPVRILLLSHFPPPLEQVTPLLLGMRPGKAGPVELGTLCHGRRERAARANITLQSLQHSVNVRTSAHRSASCGQLAYRRAGRFNHQVKGSPMLVLSRRNRESVVVGAPMASIACSESPCSRFEAAECDWVVRSTRVFLSIGRKSMDEFASAASNERRRKGLPRRLCDALSSPCSVVTQRITKPIGTAVLFHGPDRSSAHYR